MMMVIYSLHTAQQPVSESIWSIGCTLLEFQHSTFCHTNASGYAHKRTLVCHVSRTGQFQNQWQGKISRRHTMCERWSFYSFSEWPSHFRMNRCVAEPHVQQMWVSDVFGFTTVPFIRMKIQPPEDNDRVDRGRAFTFNRLYGANYAKEIDVKFSMKRYASFRISTFWYSMRCVRCSWVCRKITLCKMLLNAWIYYMELGTFRGVCVCVCYHIEFQIEVIIMLENLK